MLIKRATYWTIVELKNRARPVDFKEFVDFLRSDLRSLLVCKGILAAVALGAVLPAPAVHARAPEERIATLRSTESISQRLLSALKARRHPAPLTQLLYFGGARLFRGDQVLSLGLSRRCGTAGEKSERIEVAKYGCRLY